MEMYVVYRPYYAGPEAYLNDETSFETRLCADLFAADHAAWQMAGAYGQAYILVIEPAPADGGAERRTRLTPLWRRRTEILPGSPEWAITDRVLIPFRSH